MQKGYKVGNLLVVGEDIDLMDYAVTHQIRGLLKEPVEILSFEFKHCWIQGGCEEKCYSFKEIDCDCWVYFEDN
jgi:hypothetical protein